MLEFIITLILASLFMLAIMGIGVGITMPFHGSLIRLRANYNPRAVGLEGTENRVGPTLTTLLGTLKRVKRLEGWAGLYKGAIPSLTYVSLISIASVIFVGGSSKRGPSGTYSTPEAGGVRMGIFTIILTAISLPATIIINRSIITPYKLPYNPRQSLSIILSPSELAQPYKLYLTPGLLATTLSHSICVTLLARSVRSLLLGTREIDPLDPTNEAYNASYFMWFLFLLYQAIATAWLTPLEVIATRLSIQKSGGGMAGDEESMPEGAEYAGTDEDVIGLRPGAEPYEGVLDCARKIGEEEGWASLYRAWWFTMGGNVLSVFG